jgi:predicted alpha/beta-fold hydrolase
MDTQFIPLSGAANPHLQTILPRLVRKKIMFEPFWQRLELPDGDFLDLAWTEDPRQAQHKPRLIVFHGLEGNLHSPYAHGLLQAGKEKGWLGVVMHFRGCSGVPNRNKRIYHSGETEDARFFIHWLNDNLTPAPTAAVGFSLGGNMLGCYLGQEGSRTTLSAAVIVSAPFMLEPCSNKLDQGLSRIYQYYLLQQLKQNAKRKLHRYPGSLPLSVDELKSLKRISEFDNIITAPIHGYRDAYDYYRRCSAMPLLPQITAPLLIIHAKDDPFMTADVIPDTSQLPNNIEYQLTEHGGHVGFVGGTWKAPQMWLEQRITEWLTPFLRSQ